MGISLLSLLVICFVILKIKLVEDFSTLQFSDIQGIVLTMLKDSQNWGSFHNHNCPSEICLLCYAIVLWFNLANLTFEKYTPPAPILSVYGEDEQLQPTQRPSRASYFVSENIKIF